MHGANHFVAIAVLATTLLCLRSAAQDFPKAEIFGGYSYLHVDTHGVNGTSLTNECNILVGGPCPVTFQVHPGFNGWNVSPQANLNRWFGLKAQIAGQYGNMVSIKLNSPLPVLVPFAIPRQHNYDFLFGPVVSRRSDKYTVFGHGLIGVQHVGISGSIAVPSIGTISTSASKTDFAFALGGGLDVKAAKHLAVRIAQFDYEFVNSSGSGDQDDFRFSAGLVYRFADKK